MRRGNRKWKCADCGAESVHHWIERNRASRPRCPACGSIRLDPVTKEAKDEITHNEDMKRVGSGYPIFAGPGADKMREIDWMRERIDVICTKCKKPFQTKYRKGHWETCPSCGHAFYVSHDMEIRRMIEREWEKKRCRRFIDMRRVGGEEGRGTS